MTLLHRSFTRLVTAALLLLSPLLSLKAQGVRVPAEPDLLHKSFWSLCIQDVESGETLVNIRAHHLMTPASVLKVYTTASALSILSPDTRLATEVHLSGSVSKGVLQGDLVIIGEGDPSIASRHLPRGQQSSFFEKVVEALRGRGITTIEGEILALSLPHRDAQGRNPRWMHYDMGNHYAAGAYDLNLFDNSYDILFSNFGRDFTVSPAIPDLNLIRAYEVSPRKRSDSLYIAIPPLGGSHDRIITGVYPASLKSTSIRGEIPNPPLFFAQYLASHLRREGITVKGKGKVIADPPAPGSTTLLYRHLSPTITELARLTNVHSINLYAEALLRRLAPEEDRWAGHNITQSALHRTALYWEGRGLTPDESALYDGSGLSPENKLSTFFLVTLLGKVYRNESTRRFMDTLPIVGKEGTVSSFLRELPFAGTTRLKSGTIKHVLAYGGYVPTPDGRIYAVAVIVNNHTVRNSEMRKALGELLLDAFAPSFR